MAEAPDLAVLRSDWSKSTVPLEALDRALYAFADRATGVVDDVGDVWRVELHPRGVVADAEVLSHLFRQEVNDQKLRLSIAARTDPIRNLVFALAFSRSGLVESGTQG
jgi:His-Xaa-Ser system protein HxsD